MDMMIKKIFISFIVSFILALQVTASPDYAHIRPDYLSEEQTTEYKTLNEKADIIFQRIKTSIRTMNYPRYFHDFKLEKDDGTLSDNYYYVMMNGTELIYNMDTNELRYIAYKRPELGKCRILYDYPSGKLHAVQLFSSDLKPFIYSSDGKYIDYEPYIRRVKGKVLNNWKMPSRNEISNLASDQKDLRVSIALTINKDGSIKKYVILRSSKINALDSNAYDAIKAAAPFDAFPDDFFNDEITVTLNFNFSL